MRNCCLGCPCFRNNADRRCCRNARRCCRDARVYNEERTTCHSLAQLAAQEELAEVQNQQVQYRCGFPICCREELMCR